jgi:hypothetical protein
MKTKFLIVVFLAAITTLFAAQTVVESLTAKSEGDTIVVEWKSKDESDIRRFEVERSSENQQYSYVDNIDPRGSGSVYRFVDDEVYFKDQATKRNSPQQKKLYSYRLKIVYDNNEFAYSDVVYVSHNVNGIRRTWGMIKEMFR